MYWKYIKSIKSADLIRDFEEKYNYQFPNEYKDCVLQNNGGRPSKKLFDTQFEKEHELKSLLSFNYDDCETIWMVNEYMFENSSYIAFATDSAGNFICFDKNDSSIVFFEHETNNTEMVSNCFSEFLNSLYK